MDASACYSDTAIDPAVRSVRLLCILDCQGNNEEDSVQCAMRCFQLESAPAYTALSYHWGPEFGLWGTQHLTGQHVVLNGHRMFVRYNLYQYFQQERKRESWERSWLWIDALCIDQQNVGERNHQVGIMRDIYRQAAQVIIWLGESADGSDTAMDYLNQYYRPNMNGQFNVKSHTLWSQSEGQAVWALCRRKYWQRVWIVQEILLARKLTIRCGQKSVPFQCLETMIARLWDLKREDCLDRYCYAVMVYKSGAGRLAKDKAWGRLRFDTRADALKNLINKYERWESSEVRDKIYAFLGLLDHLNIPQEGDSERIKIDYSSEITNVFTEVYLFLRTGATHINCQVRLDLISKICRILNIPPDHPLIQKARDEVNRYRTSLINWSQPPSFPVAYEGLTLSYS